MSIAIHRPHPDPKRIAGYAFALAVNLGLLMLLLAPMQGPAGFRLPGEETPSISWYPPKQATPPVRVPIEPVRPHVVQPPLAPTRPAVVRQPEAPVLVADGSDAAALPEAPADTAVAVDSGGDIALPVQGVSLQYAAAPPPAYPTAARRMHLEGTVLLEVLVDANGRPLRVDVRQGSGHRQLDEAARDQVLARWRFVPAMRDGRAVQAIGLVPVTFTLR